jgi:hypothetical protein
MKRAQHGRSSLQKLARAFCNEVGISPERIVPGPIKSPERILLKAYARYEGQIEKVADICRLRIEIASTEDLYKIRSFMRSQGRQEFFRGWAKEERGITLEKFEDLFEKPTDMGFRCFDYKLMIDLGQNRHQRAEILVIHAGMSQTYEETHKLLEEVRLIKDLSKAVMRVRTPEEEEKIRTFTNIGRELHFDIANRLGITRLQSQGSQNYSLDLAA